MCRSSSSKDFENPIGHTHHHRQYCRESSNAYCEVRRNGGKFRHICSRVIGARVKDIFQTFHCERLFDPAWGVRESSGSTLQTQARSQRKYRKCQVDHSNNTENLCTSCHDQSNTLIDASTDISKNTRPTYSLGPAS